MSKISYFFYFLSTIITAILFYFINHLTEPVNVDNSPSNISNGNPGLFPLVFLTPFLIVTVLGTFILAYNFAEKTFRTIQYKIIMITSFLFSSIIYFFTYMEAKKFKLIIFNNNDSVNRLAEIPLLNTYSNNIFFNGWTFLAVLFTTIFFAYLFKSVKLMN